mgnify:CR=1 FL=1
MVTIIGDFIDNENMKYMRYYKKKNDMNSLDTYVVVISMHSKVLVICKLREGALKFNVNVFG